MSTSRPSAVSVRIILETPAEQFHLILGGRTSRFCWVVVFFAHNGDKGTTPETGSMFTDGLGPGMPSLMPAKTWESARTYGFQCWNDPGDFRGLPGSESPAVRRSSDLNSVTALPVVISRSAFPRISRGFPTGLPAYHRWYHLRRGKSAAVSARRRNDRDPGDW